MDIAYPAIGISIEFDNFLDHEDENVDRNDVGKLSNDSNLRFLQNLNMMVCSSAESRGIRSFHCHRVLEAGRGMNSSDRNQTGN